LIDAGEILIFLSFFLAKVYPTHNPQSPEVTSEALLTDEDIRDNVRTLTDKLSAALLNLSAKEELVKQHAKVAEEAVSGILFHFFPVLIQG
jgi:hypothetical protein